MAKASKHVQPYSPEFRAEAIRLARTSGKSHRQIAEDLGMTSETLRLWLKQADLDAGKRQDGLTSDEQEELRRLRREVRILREEREILRKAAAHLPLGRTTRSGDGVRVCGAGEGPYPVRRMCRVLDVSPSGYWAWRRREPSARRRADEELTGHIVQIHRQSRGTYGALRIQAELRARDGVRPQPGGAPHAPGGSGRLPSPAAGPCAHHPARSGGYPCPRSGRAELYRTGSRSALDCRHHVSADRAGRLSVPGGDSRRL
jgi:transposase